MVAARVAFMVVNVENSIGKLSPIRCVFVI